MGIALRRQSGVDTADILVPNVETSSPSLHYIPLAQSRHKVRSLVSWQAAKCPPRDIDVGGDDHSLMSRAELAAARSLDALPATRELGTVWRVNIDPARDL